MDRLIIGVVALLIGGALVYWYDHRPGPAQTVEINLPPVTLIQGKDRIVQGPVTIERVYIPVEGSSAAVPDGSYRHTLRIERNGPVVWGETIVTDLVSSGGATGQFSYTENLRGPKPVEWTVGVSDDPFKGQVGGFVLRHGVIGPIGIGGGAIGDSRWGTVTVSW